MFACVRALAALAWLATAPAAPPTVRSTPPAPAARPAATPARRNAEAWPLPATLPDGRRVELWADGHWRWATDVYSPAAPYLTDHARPASATQALDLVPGRLVLWLDPRAWVEDLDGRHPDPRTIEGRTPDAWLLEYTAGDAFARITARRTSVPLDVLVDEAVETLQQGLDDVQVTGETHRRANGLDQLVLEARATWRGVPVRVLGFCWSGPEGSAQIATWCPADEIEEHRPALEQLADGLVRTPRPR